MKSPNFPFGMYSSTLLIPGALFALMLAGSEPAPAQFGLCDWVPRKDAQVRFPVVHHTTAAGSYDIYQITPEVRTPVQLYREITLRSLDRVKIEACGCVQTGGSGKTWKNYVNPRGPKSDRLYSGTISLLYDNQVPPPSFWQKPTNMTRIGAFIRNSGSQGVTIPSGRSAKLLIGYEDDGYSDNGYWGHDDGTGGQCRGVGPATIQVTVYRRSR